MLQLHAAASLVWRQTSIETWFPSLRPAGAGTRNGNMEFARGPCASLPGAGVLSGQPVDRHELGGDTSPTGVAQAPDGFLWVATENGLPALTRK